MKPSDYSAVKEDILIACRTAAASGKTFLWFDMLKYNLNGWAYGMLIKELVECGFKPLNLHYCKLGIDWSRPTDGSLAMRLRNEE
jgi:hypothetical protein